MPRESDPFWGYVTFLDEQNSKWKCNLCGKESSGNVTRIKAHLAGATRYGISACTQVNDLLRGQAQKALKAKGLLNHSDRQDIAEERLERNVEGRRDTSIADVSVGASSLADVQQDEANLPDHCLMVDQSIPTQDMIEPAGNSSTYSQSCRTDSWIQLQNLTRPRSHGGLPRETLTDTPHQPDLEGRTHPQMQLPLMHPQHQCTQVESFTITALPRSGVLGAMDQQSGKSHQSWDVRYGSEIDSLDSLSSLLAPSPGELPQHFIQSLNLNMRNEQLNPGGPSALMEIDSANAFLCDPEGVTDTAAPALSQDMGRCAPLIIEPDLCHHFQEMKVLKRKLEQLYSIESDVKEELEFAASLSTKKPKKAVTNWLTNVERARNDFQSINQANRENLPPKQQMELLMTEVEELTKQIRFPEGMLIDVDNAKGSKLLVRKLVGKASQRNIELILNHLMKNCVSRLGIYGMGGIGKTTTVEHVHNRLLEDANIDGVFLITVSQSFNVHDLQGKIWIALNLGEFEKNEKKRAAKIFECLVKRKKSVLILDDVWEYFELEKVGIPNSVNGLKLVITTRLSDVCSQFRCQEIIKLELLSEVEAWGLLVEELGSETVLSAQIEKVAKKMIKEFAGLPLGIIAMADMMRGQRNLFVWKDTLEKLRESVKGHAEIEKRVLSVLRHSFFRLNNPQVQETFLCCALYPEGMPIDKKELIELFIDEGLIDGLRTREKQFNRGLTILNILQNASLLEHVGDHTKRIRMHDLNRDMALDVMSSALVKRGAGLKGIPSEENWTNDLEKVSLIGEDIRAIPPNMSPNCPTLSTLLLNYSLSSGVVIPDSFFKQLLGLKVLNLSGCEMKELPDSISDLVNLRALLLRRCSELRHIPYLGSLRSLRKLDVEGCRHLEALEGLKMLVELRYLDLFGTNIRRLSEGTLGRLVNLQYLRIGEVKGEEVAKLQALETLDSFFSSMDEFNKYTTSRKQNVPRYFLLEVDEEKSWWCVYINNDLKFENYEKRVSIWNCNHALRAASMERDRDSASVLIPDDVRELRGTRCTGMTNLSEIGSLENLEVLHIKEWEHLRVLCGGLDDAAAISNPPAPPVYSCSHVPLSFLCLKKLDISKCPKLKSLFGNGAMFSLPNLRAIEVRGCEEIESITAFAPPLELRPGAFPSLENIEVSECPKMKRLLVSEWLPLFVNLREIEVNRCEALEEVIGGPPEYMEVATLSLTYLSVENCRNMKKLFTHESSLHLPHLQNIHVSFCDEIEVIIGKRGQEQDGSDPSLDTLNSFPFPRLESLVLQHLPQLKSICEGIMSCNSIEYITLYSCPRLKRIPLCLAQRNKGQLLRITMDNEEQWNSLEWDDPSAPAQLKGYLFIDSPDNL